MAKKGLGECQTKAGVVLTKSQSKVAKEKR